MGNKIYRTVFHFACAILMSGLQTAAANTYETQLENFINVVEDNYAPLTLKKTTIGLDWKRSTDMAFQNLAQIRNSAEFYFMIADLLAGMNDAHVSMILPSNLNKQIPIQFTHIDGHAYVNYFEDVVKSERCPIEIGDELLSFNGEPLSALRSAYPTYSKYGNELTNYSMFVRQLTNMNEISGNRHPGKLGDAVTLSLKSAQKLSDYSCALTVKSTGVGLISRPVTGDGIPTARIAKLDFGPALQSTGIKFTAEQKLRFEKNHQLMMKISRLTNLSTPIEISQSTPQVKSQGRKIEVGARQPFFDLPADFSAIDPGDLGLFLNAESFYAGTFLRNGKRVGFLRIPDYMPLFTFTMTISLRYYIQKLEESSDYLIFDQTNNPGGYIVYSDLVAKAFTGSLNLDKHMRYAVKPTQSFLRSYAELKDDVLKDADSLLTSDEKSRLNAELEQNYKKIYDAYLHRTNLSEPISMLPMTEYMELAMDRSFTAEDLADLSKVVGVDLSTPKKYTKPVYMITNEFDFSGGDATPAALQDYGRAILIGSRTAGAGGSVEEFSSAGAEPFSFQLTASLMVRPGERFVENYGVHPDLDCAVSKNDLLARFNPYFTRVLGQIDAHQKSLAKSQ